MKNRRYITVSRSVLNQQLSNEAIVSSIIDLFMGLAKVKFK
tara:strand:+ start:1537 stop:1659 length:123 start_codon:yes stop_codon:yes gene_type:complete